MIDVRILPDRHAVAVAAADLIADASSPGSVLGLATGSSPDRVYEELASRHADGTARFDDVTVFTLDEYVGLPEGHSERYAAVIRRAFTDRVGIPSERVHGPDADAVDLAEAGAEYDRAIAAAGGVDLQLLGVGANGHIAFNEPGTAFDTETHVTELAEQTRRDNARFFDGDVSAVPVRAMTQGIGTILRAKRLLLIASGESKAEAIAGLVHRAPTVELPVTALHLHDSVTVLVDPAAASLIGDREAQPTIRSAVPSSQS